MTTIFVASVGVMSYVQMSNTIESDAIAKMVAVEESMGQALDKQFELIDADLRVLGNYNLTRDALMRLNAGFENLRKEGENPARFIQDAYITIVNIPLANVIWRIRQKTAPITRNFTQNIMMSSVGLCWNTTIIMFS